MADASKMRVQTRSQRSSRIGNVFCFFLNKIYSRDLKLTLGLIGTSTFAEDYKPLSGY